MTYASKKGNNPKTATEVMEMDNERRCCNYWTIAVNSIRVDPRDEFNSPAKYMSITLEKILKATMGNYCPTCGRKLK